MSIVVAHNGRWRTPFAGYVRQMLGAAGLLGWAERSIGELCADDVAILPACWLTSTEQEAVKDFVASGGALVALHPPITMAAAFGWRPTGRVLRDGYLATTDAELLPPGLESITLQCPAAMDLYTPSACDVLAWRCDPLEGDRAYPAVVAHAHGRGVAVAFAFDPAAASVRLQQGLLEQTGVYRGRDPDYVPFTHANDLFIGSLDTRLRMVPQADLYRRLLVGLVEHLAATSSQPAIRLWPYPDGVPAIATITGDSDGIERRELDRVLEVVEGQGAHYTLYLLEEHRDLVSPTDADALRRAGHGLAHHTWVGATPTAAEMREGVRTQISSFRDRYGYQPLSHRGHCCIWTGWSEQARILRGSGVLVDSNHYAYVHHQYGFVSGSGQGFEYVDEDGAPIGLWEQPTLMSDDCMLQDKTHLPALTLDEAIAETGSLIDALVTRWHGVYHVCLHPIYMRTDLPYPCTDRWAEAAAAHCRERGVPAISAEEWAAFLRARLSVTATDTVRDEEGLRITLRSAYPAAGLSMLLPEGSSSAHVNGVRARVCSRALEGRSRRIATWDMPAERDVQVRLGAESAQAAT